jgi:hypothetical protein
MRVPVVDVGKVGVGVCERFVDMLVRVWRGRIDAGRVRVPVMDVVNMNVVMPPRGVRMLVLMALGQMQPNPRCHQ